MTAHQQEQLEKSGHLRWGETARVGLETAVHQEARPIPKAIWVISVIVALSLLWAFVQAGKAAAIEAKRVQVEGIRR